MPFETIATEGSNARGDGAATGAADGNLPEPGPYRVNSEWQMFATVVAGATFLVVAAPLAFSYSSGTLGAELGGRDTCSASLGPGGGDGAGTTCYSALCGGKGAEAPETGVLSYLGILDFSQSYSWFVQGGMIGLLVMLSTVTAGMGAKVPARGIFAIGLAILMGSGFSIAFATFMSEAAKVAQVAQAGTGAAKTVIQAELDELACQYSQRGLSDEDAQIVAGTLLKYEGFRTQQVDGVVGPLPRFDRRAVRANAIVMGLSFTGFGMIPLLGVTVSMALFTYKGPEWYNPQWYTVGSLWLGCITAVLMGMYLNSWAGSATFLLSGFLMFVDAGVACLFARCLGQVCSRFAPPPTSAISSPPQSPVAPVVPGHPHFQLPDTSSTGGSANVRKLSRGQTDKVAWPSFSRRFLNAVCAVLGLACVPIVGMQVRARLGGKDDESLRVFLYGMLTCVTTGLGAVPFYFLSTDNVDEKALATANTVAGGMMLAASSGMLLEAHDHCGEGDWQILAGLAAGGLFIKASEALHGDDEGGEGEMEALHGAITGRHFRKALLIFTVLFCHSAAEGVAVGVSFSRELNAQFGMYVSLLLAAHNVPEGLAVALVLVPRGVSTSFAALIAMMTSVPQPVLAVVAYLFVDVFSWLLPVGLAFAAGAMIYVSFHELLMEAGEQIGWLRTLGITATSFMVFSAVQYVLQVATGQ